MRRRHDRDTAESAEAGIFQEEDESPLEFPEPESVASRRRVRRGLWITGTGLAVLIVLVLVLTFSPLLTVRTIEVEGNDLVTDGRAEELLQPVYGRPLPQVGNQQVADLLDPEAAVEDVVVTGELPDTLRVEIIEYPPVAEVQAGDTVEFYNEHGQVIRSFSADDAPDAEAYATPEISDDAALDDEAVFRAIVAVLGSLPEDAREQMVSATAESVDSVQLELDDGRTVMWGSQEAPREKAAVLEAVLVSEAEEFTGVGVIDISTPSAPVTRE